MSTGWNDAHRRTGWNRLLLSTKSILALGVAFQKKAIAGLPITNLLTNSFRTSKNWVTPTLSYFPLWSTPLTVLGGPNPGATMGPKADMARPPNSWNSSIAVIKRGAALCWTGNWG